jgi:hypothetical protein
VETEGTDGSDARLGPRPSASAGAERGTVLTVGTGAGTPDAQARSTETAEMRERAINRDATSPCPPRPERRPPFTPQLPSRCPVD